MSTLFLKTWYCLRCCQWLPAISKFQGGVGFYDKKAQLNKHFENATSSTQASNKRINFIIKMIFLEMLTAQRTLQERKEMGYE